MEIRECRIAVSMVEYRRDARRAGESRECGSRKPQVAIQGGNNQERRIEKTYKEVVMESKKGGNK